MLSIWALGAAGAPTPLLIAAALTIGVSFPPTGAVLRSRYPDLLGDERLVHGAYALDSVTIEVAFVSGPLLTAVDRRAGRPRVRARRLGRPGARRHDPVQRPAAGFARSAPLRGSSTRGLLGALSDRGIRMVALSTLPVGFCLGAVEVSIPAFSAEQGSAALAGVLLAHLVGVERRRRADLRRRGGPAAPRYDSFLRIAALFPLACLPMLAASSPIAMMLFVILAGAADRAADREPQPGRRRARAARRRRRVVHLADDRAGRRDGGRHRRRRAR